MQSDILSKVHNSGIPIFRVSARSMFTTYVRQLANVVDMGFILNYRVDGIASIMRFTIPHENRCKVCCFNVFAIIIESGAFM